MNTIREYSQIEFEEKKSKFIGYAKPVSTADEAKDFIAMIKNMHSDATHNCSVYRVIDNGREFFKVDDDGEPSGTAGKPMGEILTYMNVHNIVVVATRYFGGIKLGAGGLVRNYSKTAKLAVLEGGVIEFVERNEIVIDFPYELISEIENLILSDGTVITNKDYNERVTYRISTSTNILSKLEEIRDVIVIK